MAHTCKHELWYEKPGAIWEEALPLGNGSLGAMLYGRTNTERIHLNMDTLWSGHPRNVQNPDAFSHLSEVRRLVAEDRFQEAQALIESSMLGVWTESYQPLGDVLVEWREPGTVSQYRRSLSLDEAVARCEYLRSGKRVRVSCFVSHPDQLLVYRMDSEVPVDLTLRMESLLPHTCEAVGEARLGIAGQAPTHVEPSYVSVEGDGVIFDPTAPGMAFFALAEVHADGVPVPVSNHQFEIRGAKTVELRLVAASGFRGWNREPETDPRALTAGCEKDLERVAGTPMETLQERHVTDHAALFDRVCLTLGQAEDATGEEPEKRFLDGTKGLPTDRRLVRFAEQADAAPQTELNAEPNGAPEADPELDGVVDLALVTLLFQYGRYLLIASSRSDTQAANLQGIWSHDLRPAWSANYTTNINAEMNYWPVESCGLPELAQPLLNLIGGIAQSGAVTAKTQFGCRGWTVCHNSDIWRLSAPVGGSARWAYWPMGGAWLARHVWEHARFNGRADWLRKTGFPLMLGAARFVLDWLVPMPDGSLATSPSTSPENAFLTETGEACSVSRSSTMDMAIIRDLFGACLSADAWLRRGREDVGADGGDKSGECGGTDKDAEQAVAMSAASQEALTGTICVPAEQAAVLAEIRQALPRLEPYRIGRHGQLQEWFRDFDEEEVDHRHVSHLYGLYPGEGIHPRLTPQWAEACRQSLLRRGDDSTGWSLAWKVNLWARLLDGEHAWKLVRRQLRPVIAEDFNYRNGGGTYPNLMDAHPPFQIDGNFGVTAGIAEMLLQSHTDEIHLLPALPKAWACGKVSGLRARGDLTVDFSWVDGKPEEVWVTAHTAREVVFRVGDEIFRRMLQPGISRVM